MTKVPVSKKALIIGVSSYDHLPNLPVSNLDAQRFKEKLQEFEFSVAVANATDRVSVLAAIRDFVSTLNEGDIVIVYYSGHGFQRNEFNYLVPSDSPSCPGNVVRENVPVTYISEKLERNGVAAYLLILDACRTTPHACGSSTRRAIAGRLPPRPAAGLAEPRLRQDVELIYASWMIALAASPGTPAWSGSDSNDGSLYSRHLINFFGKSGWDLDKTFREVRHQVRTASSGKQIPSEYSVMVGEVFVNPDADVSQSYREQWAYTLSLESINAVADYLRWYPASPYAAMARKWLKDRGVSAGDSATGILLLSSAETASASAADVRTAEALIDVPDAQPNGIRNAARPRGVERRRAAGATPGAGTNASRSLFVVPQTADRLAAFGFSQFSAQFEPPAVASRAFQKIADNQVKAKILTLDVLESPRAKPGESVELQVQAVDGIPVTRAIPRTLRPRSLDQRVLPLDQLFPDKARGMSGANSALEQFGELKDAAVEVELSDHAPEASTQGHARIQAFQRSLQIRKGLQDSGVAPEKIFIKMPEKFLLSGEGSTPQVPQDQLTVSKSKNEVRLR